MNTRLFLVALLFGGSAGAQTPELRWFKGNTHAHSLNSDGDVPVDAVVRWYREHGYITENAISKSLKKISRLWS